MSCASGERSGNGRAAGRRVRAGMRAGSGYGNTGARNTGWMAAGTMTTIRYWDGQRILRRRRFTIRPIRQLREFLTTRTMTLRRCHGALASRAARWGFTTRSGIRRRLHSRRYDRSYEAYDDIVHDRFRGDTGASGRARGYGAMGRCYGRAGGRGEVTGGDRRVLAGWATGAGGLAGGISGEAGWRSTGYDEFDTGGLQAVLGLRLDWKIRCARASDASGEER